MGLPVFFQNRINRNKVIKRVTRRGVRIVDNKIVVLSIESNSVILLKIIKLLNTVRFSTVKVSHNEFLNKTTEVGILKKGEEFQGWSTVS